MCHRWARQEDRLAIEEATIAWIEANKRGDEAGKRLAHASAEAARNKYRGKEFAGRPDGTTYRVDNKGDLDYSSDFYGTIYADSKGLYKLKYTDSVNSDNNKNDRIYLDRDYIFRKSLGTGNLNFTVSTIADVGNFVRIKDKDGYVYYGGDQEWYGRKTVGHYGGCGPTAVANILAYLAKSNPKNSLLYSGDINNISQEDFTNYMKEIYDYVTPIGREGKGGKDPFTIGVPLPSMLESGAQIFGLTKGVNVKTASKGNTFNSLNSASKFIREGLDSDTPIAMLTWFNENLENIDFFEPKGEITKQNFQTHWVTITGMSENKKTGQTTVLVSTWGGISFINLNNNFSKGDMFFVNLNAKR